MSGGSESPERLLSSRVTRRRFLASAAALIASLATACTRTTGTAARAGPTGLPGPFSVDPQAPSVRAGPDARLTLAWGESRAALTYDVELNGVIVAEGLGEPRFDLVFGDRRPGFQEGRNTWRVRARNAQGERRSEPGSFQVVAVGGIRTRRFDHEDDGPIVLTTPASGAAMVVRPRYAFGAGGKGVALRSEDPRNPRAYKNHVQLPVAECWLRLAVRPESWDRSGTVVNLGRIRSSGRGVSEHLSWRTGGELRSSSVNAILPIPRGEWTQVQLGVLQDGGVELWAFDGRREILVGRGRNPGLRGRVKDLVSIGNTSGGRAARFEVWLDEFAVGESRLPWARSDDPHVLPRPTRLDPEALPPTFSFVFGSCNVSSRIPYRETALEAAASMDPDFVIHLGDWGYADTGAYRQTRAGQQALWADLLYEERLAKLLRRPWILLASDHDMGGNNVDSTTLSPAAAEAFAAWQNNDPTAHPEGLYGSAELDGGRILLVWLEGIRFRSPLSDPDGPNKTMLGRKQRSWLLRLLRSSRARLIIIASDTTFGHHTDTSWSQYPTERRQLYEACLAARGVVRWICGDHHAALYAAMGPRLPVGPKVAEWGAAPLAEVPQREASAAPFVTDAVCIAGSPFTRRDETLSALSNEEINAATSFGRVVVDTRRRRATFEIRDSRGRIRVAPSGFRMTETIRYA